MLIANLLGILVFLFFIWYRLKDDYHYEKIFNLAFLILLGLFLGYFFSKQIVPQYWFWSELLFMSLAFVVSIKKQKIKFFEGFDALVVSLLPILGLTFFGDSIKKSSLILFVEFWIILILVFLFFFFDSQYRRFSWYKSGRVGFSGVVIAILFFLSKMFFSFSNIDLYLSGTFAFTFLLVLYRLARRKE